MNDITCEIPFEITPQPDEATCGAACLHSIYRHYGSPHPLDRVVEQVPQLPEGGTLAVLLGLHALSEGYRATLYTFDLQMFDPTWFQPDGPPLPERLSAQARTKTDAKFLASTQAHLDFLAAGGKLRMEDLSPSLLHELLTTSGPVIVGLSSTWLYQTIRERPHDMQDDDIRGEPAGHFVVVHGVDIAAHKASIADPYRHDPHPGRHHYKADIDRLMGAIFLGIVTFDGKLLVIEPDNPDVRRNASDADPSHRQ